ncbi:MAG: TSUP family transporter [Flavobacteriia bacterium]|nr:TSUP family transporter [Flavobacteriia bacterium]
MNSIACKIKEKNELFPVFLKLNEMSIVLVGGGKVALEKLTAILTNSPLCKVKVISINFIDELKQFAASYPFVELIESAFSASHLEKAQLVITAVNNVELSEQIKKEVNAKGILCNAADKPELCDFYLGSTVTKGNLKIGISTNGKSPTIAKRLKEIFNDNIPNEIDNSLENLSKIRNHLKGDFQRKVLKLDKLTSQLHDSQSKAWYLFSFKKVFGYMASILGIMLAGHLLFTIIPLESIYKQSHVLISSLEIDFVYFMIGGFIAQMIDGALGMAYGVSATTFLLSFGISPAVASMSVHTSEIFTSGVSGFMHLRFGNVNNKLFKTILIPGVIGSVLGAYILSEFENYNVFIKPIVGVYTLILGVIIIRKVIKKSSKRQKVTHVGWLATVGGFLDSIGGGGWGPVVSSTLIASGKNPRMIIGSVNLAEFFVSLASSFTFFTLIGTSHWQTFVGLILGGVCAAPIAAYLSRKLNVKAMMLMVGIIIIIVSLRIIILTVLK